MKAVVYTKEDCQFCERVKHLLGKLEIEYLEYKYKSDFTKSEFYSEFGEGATFPQVSIDAKHIGGCKETLNYFKTLNLF
jgi:glutaredoxin